MAIASHTTIFLPVNCSQRRHHEGGDHSRGAHFCHDSSNALQFTLLIILHFNFTKSTFGLLTFDFWVWVGFRPLFTFPSRGSLTQEARKSNCQNSNPPRVDTEHGPRCESECGAPFFLASKSRGWALPSKTGFWVMVSPVPPAPQIVPVKRPKVFLSENSYSWTADRSCCCDECNWNLLRTNLIIPLKSP